MTIHSSSERSAPRSRWIDGRATFTTVLSSMIMKRPMETDPSVSHLRFSSAKIRALMRPQTSHRALGDFTWTPTPEQLASANVARLATALGCASYEELHRVSIDEPDRFWRAVVDDLGIPLASTWDDVLDDTRGIEWTTWFLGARLNVAEACVHRWARETPDREAAAWAPEEGERRALTWAELSHEVRRFAEALWELGIGKGDVVGTFLPMSPEAAIASHACAHLGAVQVPIFSGFAGPAVSSRLADAGAKLVVTADASYRRGKLVRMKDVLDEALVDAPTVQRVVVWQRTGAPVVMASGRAAWWADAVADKPGTLEAVEVDSETPYLLAYTSGTAARTPAALHAQGRFLLSLARQTAYQADLRPATASSTTDMGWIMAVDRRRGMPACRSSSWRGARPAANRVEARRARARHDARLTGLVRASSRTAAGHDRRSARCWPTGEPWNRGRTTG